MADHLPSGTFVPKFVFAQYLAIRMVDDDLAAKICFKQLVWPGELPQLRMQPSNKMVPVFRYVSVLAFQVGHHLFAPPELTVQPYES